MDDTLPPRNLFPGTGSAPNGAPRASETRTEGETLEWIGPYRVLSKLGEGGMGVVYKCRDETLQRLVAVKVIRKKYASDEQYRRRFLREAQAQTRAALSHPTIAAVYVHGECLAGADSLVYLAMEYVDGPSVDALLNERGRIPLAQALRIARETALGLREAKAKDLVHRDIKPSNLLVTPAGGVKIVDFGLAKEIGSASSMTDTGVVMGTPHYISPEQGRGHSVDHRSDIYSLGATLYHMITGRPPFEGDSQVSVIVAHVNEAPVPPRDLVPDLPEGVSRVILRMLAKDSSSRYPDYDDLIEDLEAVERGDAPPHATRWLAEEPPLQNGGDGAPTAAPARSPGRRTAAPFDRLQALRWTAAVVIALAAIAAAATGTWVLLTRPSVGSPSVSGLGSWYSRLEDGRDLLSLDFARPPDGQPGGRSWRECILFPPEASARGRLPEIEQGRLALESFPLPLRCAQQFRSIDEVQLFVGPTKGSFDLAVSIVDPAGQRRRSISLRVRPAEITPSPLAARRSGEEIPVIALDTTAGPAEAGPEGKPQSAHEQAPFPRIGQGPFEILLGFSREDGATTVKVLVSRKHAARPLYDASCRIEGNDWSSGVLEIEAPSPVHPYSFSIERILIWGNIDPRTRPEGTAWPS